MLLSYVGVSGMFFLTSLVEKAHIDENLYMAYNYTLGKSACTNSDLVQTVLCIPAFHLCICSLVSSLILCQLDTFILSTSDNLWKFYYVSGTVLDAGVLIFLFCRMKNKEKFKKKPSPTLT